MVHWGRCPWVVHVPWDSVDYRREREMTGERMMMAGFSRRKDKTIMKCFGVNSSDSNSRQHDGRAEQTPEPRRCLLLLAGFTGQVFSSVESYWLLDHPIWRKTDPKAASFTLDCKQANKFVLDSPKTLFPTFYVGKQVQHMVRVTGVWALILIFIYIL